MKPNFLQFIPEMAHFKNHLTLGERKLLKDVFVKLLKQVTVNCNEITQ